MNTMLDRLNRISPWHFVWISIVFSELITAVFSTAQGYLYWGRLPTETLIIGAVDALVVPLIVASVVVYFVRQTAELNRMNAQLQEANRRLQVLDKMKTDFVSVVSHELRTPLTTIKAFAELISMKPNMSEQRRKKLMNTINIEAARLSRLISDLLDLARIEEGALLWRSDELSLKDVVLSAMGSVGPLFENKGQRVTTAFSLTHPGFRGDHDRLVQVVTNILSNAAKYTPAGGSVHVAVRRDSGPAEQMVVEVSDTGVGIPSDELEAIFEKFHRSGDPLTSSSEGTGLGLAIARQIVEHYGGRIWAESTQSKGSKFIFTLPVESTGMQNRAVSP
jgi:signal transduction histidine kinase